MPAVISTLVAPNAIGQVARTTANQGKPAAYGWQDPDGVPDGVNSISFPTATADSTLPVWSRIYNVVGDPFMGANLPAYNGNYTLTFKLIATTPTMPPNNNSTITAYLTTEYSTNEGASWVGVGGTSQVTVTATTPGVFTNSQTFTPTLNFSGGGPVWIRLILRGTSSGTLSGGVVKGQIFASSGWTTDPYAITWSNIPPPQVAVSPHGVSVTALPNATSSERFVVQNLGTSQVTYTLTSICSGTATSCTTPSAITLPAGGSANAPIAFHVGATGTTGTVKLIASGSNGTDTGFVNVTAGGTIQSPTIDIQTVNAATTVERSLCLAVAAGRSAAYECGDLRIVHPLPGTRTLGRAHIPFLVYNSQQANPYPLVAANIGLVAGAATPDSVVLQLFDSTGVFQKDRRSFAGSGWSSGRASRVMARWDTLTPPTAIYSYVLQTTFWYGGTSKVTDSIGRFVVVNRKDSYFGAGWWLAGLEHLYFPADTMKILWVGGEGDVGEYTRVVGTTTWRAPNVTRPDSLTRSGSPGSYTYSRHASHGVQVQYDTYGRHAATINRLGYQTTFTYSIAPTDTLKTITLPPTGSGKTYTFAYSGNQLASVTAPSVVQGGQTVQRVTILTVSGGRITQIQDPDNSTVGFGYVTGDTNRIVSRTDRRGKTVSYTYDSGRRLIKDSLNLGTVKPIVIGFRPSETLGMVAAVDTAQAYTKVDGARIDVGDTTIIWLDRFGAPRRIRDAVGNETNLTRGDSNWPALVTRLVAPSGRITSSTYDGHGNVLTTTDSSTVLGGRYSTIRNEWDPKWDFVTKTVPPENDSTVMSYDATTGNRLWQQDARGSSSRVTFRYYSTGSGAGLLEATQTPLGFKDSIVYDALGNLAASRSFRGYWANHYSDGIGRDTLVTSPTDTTVTRFVRQHTSYDVKDRVLSFISAGDGAISGADSVIVSNTFDPEGEQLTLSRIAAPDLATIGTSTTQWRYDAAGRRVAEVSADGRVDSAAYDRAGNVLANVNRRGYVISSQYDVLSRLVLRVVPDVPKLDTTASGWHFPRYSLPTFVDTATFTYNAMGNLLTAYNRYAQVKRTYNQNGTLQTDTLRIRTYADLSSGGDFTSHVYGLSHGYDLDGRRLYTKIPHQLGPHYAAAPTVIYDSIAYTYASYGAISSARDVLGNVFGYSFDLDGRLDTLEYPLGDYKHYTYDSDGNAINTHEDRTASGNQGQNNDIQAQYNVPGKIVQLIPNSSVAGWGWQPFKYNGSGPLYSNEQKSLVLNIITPRDNTDTYGVDALGNITILTSSYNYSYHCSSATMSVTGGSRHPRHYASGTGRLVSVNDSASESQSSDDNTHCASFSSGSSRGQGLQYDRAGNNYWVSVDARDSASSPGCNQGYCPTNVSTGRTARYYDADSRLRVVDAQDGGTYNESVFYSTPPGFEEYRYDALGRRVLRRARQLRASPANSLDQIQRFIWDGSQLVAEIQYPGSDAMSAAQLERDTTTLTTDSHYFGRVIYLPGEGGDRPVSIVRIGFGTTVGGQFKSWDPLGVSPRWDIQGRGYDQAFYGTTPSCLTVGTDTQCALPGWPTRQAYGMAISYPTFSHTIYNGWWGSLAQDQMDATGHLYRRNRYYDQNTGRFTQEDPIGVGGGLNLYGFSNGDPVNFSDPFGLCPDADIPNTICVAFFIKAAKVFPFLKGDARDFSSNSDPKKSRGYIVIDLQNKKELTHGFSPSCWRSGSCSKSPSPFNQIGANFMPDGKILVSWIGSDSKTYQPEVAAFLYFIPDGKGSYHVKGWASLYPSIEAYQYDAKGTPHPLLQRPEESSSLSALLGEFPIKGP